MHPVDCGRPATSVVRSSPPTNRSIIAEHAARGSATSAPPTNEGCQSEGGRTSWCACVTNAMQVTAQVRSTFLGFTPPHTQLWLS